MLQDQADEEGEEQETWHEDADEAMDADAGMEEEMLHEDEAMEGAVDAVMVPAVPLVPLQDVPPISSLHHHHSSCRFQVLLLMHLLLLLLLPLYPWYHRTPLLALRQQQLVPRNVPSLPVCSIAPPLPTSHNKHTSLTR
jgi:hypothetical protein